MPSYRPVQSVQRALTVLVHLNQRPLASIAELHEATGLPKPTLVRLLETLESEGFVSRDPGRPVYRITSRVRSLSEGFQEESAVVQRIAPLARDLTSEIRWPLAVGTFDRDAMLVRYSTIPDSPLALFRSTVNLRLPMLASAMGIAYLAFCPASENRLILDLLQRSEATLDRAARSRARLGPTLQAARRRGYAVRGPGARKPVSGESASVSVPVREGERVLACISITFMARVMTPATAARRHLAQLQEVARAAVAEPASSSAPLSTEVSEPASGHRDLARRWTPGG